jgi:membrane-associated phospholipid phosphatase
LVDFGVIGLHRVSALDCTAHFTNFPLETTGNPAYDGWTVQTSRRTWLPAILCLLLSLLGAIGFLVVTMLVRADLLRKVDFDMTVLIQNAVPHSLDAFFTWFGVIAKFQIIVPALVILLCVMWRWVIAVSSLGLLFIAHVLELIGKEILFQPPPPFMFYRHPTEFVFPELHTFDHSSYPSGHSMRIVFAAMTLGLAVWQIKKMPVFLRCIIVMFLMGVAAMTMFTRVSLGEHWLSDVLGGACLGVFVGGLNWVIMLKRWKAPVQFSREKISAEA